MSAIEEIQSAVERVAGVASTSVVGIGRRLRGSGIVIADGRVLTNAHNVRGEEVTVTFTDGRRARGRLAGLDLDGDLAVIEVDTAGAASIGWNGSSAASVGTPVFAAAATSSGGTRVTFGLVSATSRAFRGPGGRVISGSVEHTAPLASGSSGSPLLDADGRLVGINTNRIGDGFYLAIPADESLRTRVDALGRGESVERPRLGVAIAPAHVARRLRRSVGLPERDGLLVRDVEEGSPAARADIRQGDLIVDVAGRPVADPDALIDAVASATAPYEVRIVRGTEERTVTVGGATQATGEA